MLMNYFINDMKDSPILSLILMVIGPWICIKVVKVQVFDLMYNYDKYFHKQFKRN